MDKKSDSIFSRESIDKVSSPEQLDDYIKVAKPDIWIVLAAFFILAASVIAWGFMGVLPKTLTVSGLLNSDDSVTCYVSVGSLEKDINDIVGCKANITAVGKTNLSGTVLSVSQNPYSAEEIAAMHESDWIVNRLLTGDYSYAVTVRLDGNSFYVENTVADVTLITEEVKPISFILN